MKPTAEERSIVDDYPLSLPGVELEERSKAYREVLSNCFPSGKDAINPFLDLRDFSFTKGSVLFHATYQEEGKMPSDDFTREPYLTIYPEPKGEPILRMDAETLPEPMSVADFKKKLDATVSEAFYKRQIDPHELLPKEPYLDVHCNARIKACLNIARGLLEHPEPREHLRTIFQADIGDIRLKIRYYNKSVSPCNHNSGFSSEDSFEAELLEMKLPTAPDERGAELVKSFVIPQDAIQQAKDRDAFRKYLNCQITAYSRGNELLLNPLHSSWHGWMRYELLHAKELNLDGYRDQDGRYHTCANDRAFREVMGKALLQEPISKTIWLKEKNEKIEDFQFLGLSRGNRGGLSFVVLTKDRMPLIVPPDAIIPSQMRLAGCPFTEKEYGIPLDKIPKPIQERGILNPPKTLQERKPRKDQILALAERRIQTLSQELQQSFGIDRESSLRAIHKATIAVKEKPIEKDKLHH